MGQDDRVDTPTPWPGRWFPFGATTSDEGTNFALWAEGATSVDVCLFDDGGRESRYPLTERTFHVWHGFLPGIGAGQRYGFRADGAWDPEQGQRFNHAKLMLDPYARAIDGELRYEPAAFGHDVTRDDRTRSDLDSAGLVPTSVVVDGSFATVGSANLDVRSFRLNFELIAVLYDEASVKRIEVLFEEDCARSTEITVSGWAARGTWPRLLESVGRLLSPLL